MEMGAGSNGVSARPILPTADAFGDARYGAILLLKHVKRLANRGVRHRSGHPQKGPLVQRGHKFFTKTGEKTAYLSNGADPVTPGGIKEITLSKPNQAILPDSTSSTGGRRESILWAKHQRK